MISLFTHGSPNKIDKFRLFNGKINRTKQTVVALDHDVVFSNNNNDAYGSGVYAFFGVETKQASLHAAHGDNPGYVYVFKVNHNGYINDLPSDYIASDEWLEIIDNVMSEIRRINGFDEVRIQTAISDFVSDWEDTGEAPFMGLFFDELKDAAPDLFDEVPPDEYYDCYEWQHLAEEHLYNFVDPCNLILEEIAVYKSSEGFINDAITSCDNLWEVIRKISDVVSVVGSNGNLDFYSEIFHKEVCKYEYRPGDLSVAKATESFGVIFNTDAIEIRNVIDLSQIKENKSSVHNSLDL